jgi:plastocyanin
MLAIATSIIGVVGASAQTAPHPARIVAGSCAEHGEVVAALSHVSRDMKVGSAASAGAQSLVQTLEDPVKASFTTVSLALADIVARGHAIIVDAGGGTPETAVACGDIGGFTLDTTDLQVGLVETDGSGITAISWLHDNGDGTTTISIVILPPAGTASASTADGTDEAVVIREFLYQPNPVEVESGTTVIWTNEDPTPHTVTATEGAFDSEFMARGDTFSLTFDIPGTFDYFCAFHPRMRATIIVR